MEGCVWRNIELDDIHCQLVPKEDSKLALEVMELIAFLGGL